MKSQSFLVLVFASLWLFPTIAEGAKQSEVTTKKMQTQWQSAFVQLSPPPHNFVTQMAQNTQDYTPPSLSRNKLGTIPVAQASSIQDSFQGLKKALRLPGGQIYIDADLAVDADGSPRAKAIDPCCGQIQTSLSVLGKAINAEKVPYFVLPGNNKKLKDRFYSKMGLKPGDIAVVIYRDRVEYAIFADVGPIEKIGEGSIALKRSLLDQKPIDTSSLSVKQVQEITKSGIEKDVIYIVFPNSKPTDLTLENIVEKIRAKGKELFKQIGGNPD